MKTYEKLKEQYLEDDEPDEELEPLNEIISFRTGVIAGFLMKTKQYATKIDTEVRNLRRDASNLKRANTPEDTNKSLADALQSIGTLFYLQRKMTMYDALVSASTGVGMDQSKKILQKMEKKRR